MEMKIEAMHEQEYDHQLCELNVVPKKKKDNSAKKLTNGHTPKKPKTP